MKALAAPAALLLLAAGCAAPDAPEPDSTPAAAQRFEPPSFYLGGIQVNEDDPQQWLAALQEAGMNTIHVTEYAKHGDWDSDNLSWNEENPNLLAEIRAAKKQGLHVVLILRVDLEPELRAQQIPMARHDPARERRSDPLLVSEIHPLHRAVGGNSPSAKG